MIQSRLLSNGPRLQHVGHKIRVTLSWWSRVCWFGARSRELIIDPAKKAMLLRDRTWWFRKRRRRIAFEAVEAVTYGYDDWSFSPWAARDSYDRFAVGLAYFDGSEQSLFHFSGAGTFRNDSIWPDWCYWEEFTYDMSGTQASESLAFAELLSQLLDVSIRPPSVG